jgi:hypothetical protein
MKKSGLILLVAVFLVIGMTAGAFANQVTGKITTWHKASQMALPTEVPAPGVTVVIGKNININTNASGADTIHGNVVARTETDGKGNFTVDVPTGQGYTMIIWKKGHTPATYTVNSPGTANGQISKSDRVMHLNLKFEK